VYSSYNFAFTQIQIQRTATLNVILFYLIVYLSYKKSIWIWFNFMNIFYAVNFLRQNEGSTFFFIFPKLDVIRSAPRDDVRPSFVQLASGSHRGNSTCVSEFRARNIRSTTQNLFNRKFILCRTSKYKIFCRSLNCKSTNFENIAHFRSIFIFHKRGREFQEKREDDSACRVAM